MSSITCYCDAIIPTGGNLPWAGELIAETDLEQIITATKDEILSFLQAVVAGQRDDWLVKRYGRVIDISDESILYESASRYWLSKAFAMPLYQCPKCHRVLIASRRAGEEYRSFQPEGSNGNDLFRDDAG